MTDGPELCKRKQISAQEAPLLAGIRVSSPASERKTATATLAISQADCLSQTVIPTRLAELNNGPQYSHDGADPQHPASFVTCSLEMRRWRRTWRPSFSVVANPSWIKLIIPGCCSSGNSLSHPSPMDSPSECALSSFN